MYIYKSSYISVYVYMYTYIYIYNAYIEIHGF